MTEDSTTRALTDEDLKAVEAVKGRLKFFFSDANVRQDIFIRRRLMDAKSKFPKQVPIESLLKFNTIKKHSTKPAVIVEAAKEVPDLLSVNEEETAVGRVVPFTYDMMGGHIPKSLHLKNLPLKKKPDGEGMQYAVTVDDVRGPFEKYGEVVMIKLKWSNNPEKEPDREDGGNRSPKSKFPTGCALVEFATEADLEKAAEATLTTKDGETKEPKEKIILGDEKSEIQIMLLSEIKKDKEPESRTKKRQFVEGRDNEVEYKKFTFDWQPGCVIKITGVPSDCDREAILDAVATSMGIDVEQIKDKKIYVDYSRGDKDGAIRFPEHGEHIAAMCKSFADGTLKIKDSTVEGAQILDGDAEKKHWEDYIAFRNRLNKQKADERRSRKKRRSS